MKITFIGYGNVGAPLADHLQKQGHVVTLAAENSASESVTRALARNPNLLVASPQAAVREAEVIFLATPFQANEAALKNVAAELSGKILVDCTNPVGPGLSHGLRSERAGSQWIQSILPDTKVVKAFSIYGFENFENSTYPNYNVQPAMLFCGNDADSKHTVSGLIAQLGWEPVDVGGLEQALHLEHMTLLWVRMVRAKGGSPHMVWGALRRSN